MLLIFKKDSLCKKDKKIENRSTRSKNILKML